MLVLTRKTNETIRIGTDITITLTRIRGNQVQIGIDAPRDVAIRRGELAILDDVELEANLNRQVVPESSIETVAELVA
ncbi:MAG: carbon storage regulator [Planctomycetota bacterium]